MPTGVYIKSAAHRAALAASLKGVPHSLDRRLANSNSKKGVLRGPYSAEHRAAISASQTPEIRAAKSRLLKGKQNALGTVRSQEFRDNLSIVASQQRKLQWKDPVYRAKMLEVLARSREQHYHSSYRARTGESYRLHSSWELAFAEYLDVELLTWDYESARFDYCWPDGTQHVYLPDFWISDWNYFIEIKPSRLVTQIVESKLLAVRNAGFQIELYTEKELEILGISVR